MNATTTSQGKRPLLGLRIPERTSSYQDTFLVSIEKMEEWIAALPVANIGETAHQVYQALIDFNRTEIPDHERLKIAELLRQPARYVKGNLEKHYVDTGLPLSPKGRKIAALSRELHAEMAIPYKIIIENSLGGGKRLDRTHLALAIYRAIKYLSDVLYQSALIYCPEPKGIWQEIHRLYAFAAQNRLDKIDVEGNHSVSDLYKRILLFSVASPASLRQRESQFIYTKLLEWSPHTDLNKPTSEPADQGQFSVRLSSDAPPAHITLQNQKPQQDSRTLHTDKLIQHLQTVYNELPPAQKKLAPNPQTHLLSKTLLKRLIIAWSKAPNRESVRTRQGFDLNLAVGLTTIHTLLKQGMEEQQKTPSSKDLADIDWLQHQVALNHAFGGEPGNAHAPQELVFSLNPIGDEDSGEKHYSSTIIGTTLQADTPAPWTNKKAQQSHATVSRKTLNESAGGFCLNWLGADCTKIWVGELVGIQSTADQNQYGLAVVRWMRETPGKELLLGVQILTRDCKAVKARPLNKDHNDPKICLILPEVEAMQRPPNLVSPTFLYEVGETLRIEENEGEQLIRLDKLLESTGAFARFQFSYLEPDKTQPCEESREKPEDSNAQEDNYDSVWNML